MAKLTASTKFEEAKGFYNISLCLKDGSRVQLGGIPDTSKLKGKAQAYLAQLATAGERDVKLLVTYNDLTTTEVAADLDLL